MQLVCDAVTAVVKPVEQPHASPLALGIKLCSHLEHFPPSEHCMQFGILQGIHAFPLSLGC